MPRKYKSGLRDAFADEPGLDPGGVAEGVGGDPFGKPINIPGMDNGPSMDEGSSANMREAYGDGGGNGDEFGDEGGDAFDVEFETNVREAIPDIGDEQIGALKRAVEACVEKKLSGGY